MRAVVAGAVQELVTPVVGDTRLERAFVVERDEVGRIAEARQYELESDRAPVYVDISFYGRVVRAHPEARIAEHVLDRQLPAI